MVFIGIFMFATFPSFYRMSWINLNKFLIKTMKFVNVNNNKAINIIQDENTTNYIIAYILLFLRRFDSVISIKSSELVLRNPL